MLLERIKELCNSEGITITELERILNFGNGTIHNWDIKNPSLEKVRAVAEHFGVGIDFLVSDLQIPSKESRELAMKFEKFTDEQKNLVRCYMFLIEAGKVS